MGNHIIYSFTPKKSGPYYINLSDGVHDLFLLDQDCKYIGTHDFLVGYGFIIAATTGIRSMIEKLEAGKTYYLVTRESYRPLSLIVTDGVRELGPVLRIGYALIGGMLWSTMLRHRGTVYAVPLAGTAGEKLQTVVGRFLTIPYFLFFAFPLALLFSLMGVA